MALEFGSTFELNIQLFWYEHLTDARSPAILTLDTHTFIPRGTHS